MSWEDRLAEAAYISPSGIRTVLIYENVEQLFEKKTTAFEVAEGNETFVQDLGHTGFRLPLRIFFTGADYDLAASDFLKTLQEQGIGTLEHPIYGTFDVVPFGSVRRRDDLKTGANQAIFEVTFWETARLLFPVAGTAPADVTREAINASVETSSEAFVARINTSTQIEEVTLTAPTQIEEVVLTAKFQDALGKVRAALQSVADVEEEVATQFNAVFDSINAGIDTLIGDPLSLAFQAQILVGLPARSVALIADRLDAYGNLLTDITSQIPLPGLGNDAFNGFLADELFAMATVLGSTGSVVNNEFATQSDTVAAADALLEQFEQLSTWRDDSYKSLGEIDTGDTYQQVLRAVLSATGFLIEISFTLQQERTLVLDRPRTPVDLVAELYGTFGAEDDEQLDFFINSNRLVGLNILEVPKGSEVVYYVAAGGDLPENDHTLTQ